MSISEWVRHFPAAFTICDAQGIILEMNEVAAQTYEGEGGRALIGRSILNCHPEPARTKIQQLLAAQGTNVHTIEKSGVKKLIYQAPWYAAGQYAGPVKLALPIPFQMPHFVRS